MSNVVHHAPECGCALRHAHSRAATTAHVAVRTLGGLSLQIGNAPLVLTSLKGNAVLRGVIALGASEVPRERLTRWLWPESDARAARAALDTALHRLRHALGGARWLLLRHGRLSLDRSACWLDIDEFDTEFRDAHQPQLELRLARLALYQGLFLPDLDGPSQIDARRHRLHARFLRLSTETGALLEAALRWGDALACYERWLELDDLHEPLYQGALRCLRTLDRKAEARRLLQRCEGRLQQALGVAPAAATLALDPCG